MTPPLHPHPPPPPPLPLLLLLHLPAARLALRPLQRPLHFLDGAHALAPGERRRYRLRAVVRQPVKVLRVRGNINVSPRRGEGENHPRRTGTECEPADGGRHDSQWTASSQHQRLWVPPTCSRRGGRGLSDPASPPSSSPQPTSFDSKNSGTWRRKRRGGGAKKKEAE